MKHIFIGMAAIATLAFTACNTGNTAQETKSSVTQESAPATGTDAQVLAGPPPTFSNIDPKSAAMLTTLYNQYFEIKNGLAADDDVAAASGGASMAATLAKADKSGFTPEQLKVFTENEADLLEHAEHISANKGNISHQREHFETMSEDVYALLTAFGSGRPAYLVHCPMYNDNKGASWISEVQTISNPYMGQKMSTCGKVKQLIQ